MQEKHPKSSSISPSFENGKRVKGKVKIRKKALRQSEVKETYFFDKYDYSENKIVFIGKWVLFCLLLVVEILIAVQMGIQLNQAEKIPVFIFILLLEIALAVAELLKMFLLKGGGKAFGCYAFQILAAFLLTALTGHGYLIYLNMIILTSFYLSSKNALWSLLVFLFSMSVYIATYAIVSYISGDFIGPLELLTRTFGALIALTLHFIIVNFLLGFYKQYIRLKAALKALKTSNEALETAYDKRSEVALLQERQRIAKDIHDTAGHSITTVIMQTEAAKLIFDKNPKEAKSKLIAANLQAKHALEELRNSVHLLSGVAGKETLKSALQRIVNDSTDGTEIIIRSKIEDVVVSDAKYRFITNTLKEGISNGLRHGNATAFWFELKVEDKKIHFLLSDNGEGIDINKMEEGMGLSGMVEHAERLGGKLRFLSGVGEGFEIQITLPIDSTKN